MEQRHLPPLSDQELRAIWEHLPLPVVRRLLWEIRRLKDEHGRLNRLFTEAYSFSQAVKARSNAVGDAQLQVYWNRLRALIEEEQALREQRR